MPNAIIAILLGSGFMKMVMLSMAMNSLLESTASVARVGTSCKSR